MDLENIMYNPEDPDILEEVVVALVGLPIAFSLQKMVETIQECDAWNVMGFSQLGLATVFLVAYYFFYARTLQYQLRFLSNRKDIHAFLALLFLVISIIGLIVSGVVYQPECVSKSVNSILISTLGMTFAVIHAHYDNPEFLHKIRNYNVLSALILVFIFTVVLLPEVIDLPVC